MAIEHATSEMDDLLGVHGVEVETSWMKDGKCADMTPSTFFPSDGVGVEVAKRICTECAVKGACLEYALEHRIDHGVWGGTSERQRRRILRARKLGFTPPSAAQISPQG